MCKSKVWERISRSTLASLAMLVVLLFCGLAHAQTGDLQRLSITPVDSPDAGIPVFRDHPDKAAIIIESSLTNLVFESNMGGIVDQRSESARGRYILIIEPFTQILQVNAPGFITGRFRVAAPQARDVLYYEIEPEEVVPELVPAIFNVTPADARLFIDDQITEINQTVQLPPGPKQVRLEREGYRVLEDVITVSMDNVLFTYQMEQIDIVLVQIRTNVPGAAVLIDGSERGGTDSSGGLDFFLYPGSYALSVSHSGYLPQSRTLEVSEDGETRVRVDLVRNIGTLSLQISPSDATVQLNRQDYSGRSRIELSPGRYRLEVEKQGYEPHSETIDIGLNEQTSRTVNLQAHTGSLQFTVSPTNASVSLRDGSGRTVERWEGSRLMRGLRVGQYTLILEASGYQRGEQRVTINKDQTVPVNVVLEPAVAEERTAPVTRPAAAAQGRDNSTRVVEVRNPRTGQVWMDRNLGASRAATSSTDSQAYGDLYQWGRGADGHQRRNSQTTSTLSRSDQPGHGSFITSSRDDNWDWRRPQNNNLWQGVNGVNNPCPAGYRLPTDAEWEAERRSWGSNNASGAFGSPLKLPMAGSRGASSGSLFSVGSRGLYWASTVSGSNARVLNFRSSSARMTSDGRAGGGSVRCLKD